MPDHPLNRATDKRVVTSWSQFIADNRAIIYPLTVLALGLGLKFSTPAHRLDAVEELQKADHVNVQVLVKLQCFNPTFSDEQRAMAGLEGCGVIRQGLPDPSLGRK
jgi:hypothetical protein